MPKGRVETRAWKVQGQAVEDKHGSLTASGGWPAMKSLGIFIKRFLYLGSFVTWDSEGYSGLPVFPWALLRTHKVEASVYWPLQTT